MPISKHKFRSPNEWVDIVDNTETVIETAFENYGAAIIGTTAFGRAMVPIEVESRNEYKLKFGNPQDGRQTSDYWRDATAKSPTFGAYAAMAYLSKSGPVKMVKLLCTGIGK